MSVNTKSPAKATKRRTTTKVEKAENVVIAAEVKPTEYVREGKKTVEMVQRLVAFDEAKATSYDRLMDTKRRSIVDGMSLSKLAENFIKSGVNLTDKQREVLTFKNIIVFVKGSKYAELKLFTPQQMVYICSGVIKEHDTNTARAERAAKQNKKEAAK
jgi:hypothetical protein